MTGYAIRRGLTVIPVLVGVSLLVFSFVHLIPGDPALTMLGERATPEKVTEVRARLGLDRPLWEQYLLYVRKVVHGDLGVSIVRGDPVATDLWRRFPATVELASAAMILATVIGVPLGVVCAVRRNSLIDSLARVGALTGVSMGSASRSRASIPSWPGSSSSWPPARSGRTPSARTSSSSPAPRSTAG